MLTKSKYAIDVVAKERKFGKNQLVLNVHVISTIVT